MSSLGLKSWILYSSTGLVYAVHPQVAWSTCVPPIGLTDWVCNWLLISFGMIWIIWDDATFEWSLEITLRHKVMELIIRDYV